jgi:hypothetical protein
VKSSQTGSLVGMLAVAGFTMALACSDSAGGGGRSGGSSASGGSGGRGGSGGSMGGSGGAGGSSAGSGGSSAGSGGSAAGSGGTTGGSGGSGALATYKTCPLDQTWGEFNLALGDGFTGVQGAVLDGVEPERVYKQVKMLGGCRVMQPPEATAGCTPGCTPGVQNCVRGACVAKPMPRNVGNVTLTGLKVASLQLQKNSSNVYSNPASVMLPNPGFDEGADITLTAAGGDGYAPFTMKGWGVAPMVVPPAKLKVEMGKPTVITWTPGKQGPAKVLINFSVNRHGQVDTSLECEVPDTGSFTVEGTWITDLFQYGLSGFPSVDLTRRSADSTTVKTGCVQFLVTSIASVELDVPGVVSCRDPMDCTGGQQCKELRCQ